MALAQVFEAFAGPEAPVEFVAYDGSRRPGRPGRRSRSTVRSPAAVAVPGSRHRASSGCRGRTSTGDIDLVGDPYEALRGPGRSSMPAGGPRRSMPPHSATCSPRPGPGRRARCPRRRRRSRAAGGCPGHPPLRARRRRRDRPPLRRGQPLLRTRPRPDDGLHLRGLPQPGCHAGRGADREGRPRVPAARPQVPRDAPA